MRFEDCKNTSEMLAYLRKSLEDKNREKGIMPTFEEFLARFYERHPEWRRGAGADVLEAKEGILDVMDAVKALTAKKPLGEQMLKERLDWAKKAANDDQWDAQE